MSSWTNERQIMSPRSSEPPDFAASQLFLRRLAYSLVRDEARAEDLVQETWATWVERRPSGLAEPRAWLARVLRNRAFNLKRADARRSQHEELAGRPDPSGPETDGTLEAQAQLLEALRKLEEPYRSTLVQRYYHDLAPSAIAERAGAPLNTVKARLARGLEKLRGEMDRRYHGDRRAWCHWLTVMGTPPVPVVNPGAPGGVAQAAGATSGGAILAWCGVAAALVAAGVWKSGWRSEPRPPAPPAVATEAERPADEPRSGRSESVREDPVGEPRAERESAFDTLANLTAPAPAPLPALGYGGNARPVRERFDWPQFGGGPTHDNYREREDEIHAPKVLWFVPGCAGQPTLDGDDLYTGGLTLARLDASTGMAEGLGFELLLDFLGFEGDPPDGLQAILGSLRDQKRFVERLAAMDPDDLEALREVWQGAEGLAERLETLDMNDPAVHAAVGSPALTSKQVLVRRARDGSVIAFDRELSEEVWRWESGWDPSDTDSPSTRVPLCVTEEGIVLVPLHERLIALREKDGRELWRFSVNGAIEMVPAADDGRVFFGTDRGLFVALSASTGKQLWRVGTDGFSPCAPVVAGGRVLAVAHPWNRRDSDGFLRAWEARSGAPSWKFELAGGQQSVGIGLGEKGRSVVVFGDRGIDLVDLESGKPGFLERIRPVMLSSGTPAVVGNSLVFAEEGRLYVHDVEGDRRLRWTFQLPPGAKVQDFVHTGQRLYVATSIGLFCLADDEEKAAVGADFVLEWDGDPRVPSYLADEK